ncbi:MAG: ATP-binding protein [Anaerolineae bacterium]|nr:ATP-binding protein [Anaerolineae bacterium]
MGFITYDVPPEHPDFGRAVPCSCRLAEEQARRLTDLLEVSNLRHLAHMTFDTFLPEGQGLPEAKRRNLRHAYELARAFAAEPKGWLFFLGGYGCGKTHLAAAIANARIAQGQTVLFVVVPDLLDYLRATFAPGSPASFDERFQALREAPLLILDDLGAHSSTSWAQEKLYQLLNHRYNSRLPTVITSNHRLEEMDPRLRSRLVDPTLVTMYTILAPDFRLAGADQAVADLSSLPLHADQTFDSFNLRTHELPAEERENLKQAVTMAQNYAAHPEGWLVFTGSYGCGKTHLAAAIANRCLELGQVTPMFIVVPDLLDHLRATFSPQSQVSFDRRFEAVRTAPLLILDDLGTESATPWAKEKLFQLLNYRYTARLPTVITTSVPIEELEPRLASRILDVTRCTTFAILAPSYRGQIKPRRQRTRK